jgi:hypothetical protein
VSPVLMVLLPLWFCAAVLAVSLCRAAGRPVPVVKERRQERQSRAALYPHTHTDVSSVCASKPQFGECPLFMGSDDE